MCTELDTLKREAVQVLREVKRIRRSKDVSFYEDAELNDEKYKIINAVLKRILPWIEPTQYDPTLKKFPNYSELWGSP